MTSTAAAGDVDRPAGETERVAALDVLRGIAVGGILLANVFVFFGLIFATADRQAALPFAAVNDSVVFAETVFVQGKFYSIFSLLFGIGFGLQLMRRGDAAVPRFKRRLKVLLGIGAIHAFLIWAGDILLVYAWLGFAMPWFARRTDRQLLRWTVGLLAIPTGLYLIATVIWALVGSGAPPDPSNQAPPPEILARFEAMGTGGAVDALIGNLIFVLGRWADLWVTVRFPKILGMFVLGLWLVRRGVIANPAAHRELLVKWRRIGLLVGLPLNALAAWVFLVWPYLPPTLGGLAGVAGQAVGIPLLAIGYASAVALAVIDGRKWIQIFAPVGRMALTNYLMHSVICVTLSYGFGFGLWWRVGALQTWGIALVIIAIQIPLSAWWLRTHRYGPAEWVWRRFTYGRQFTSPRVSAYR
jgi:uncharacterized protein